MFCGFRQEHEEDEIFKEEKLEQLKENLILSNLMASHALYENETFAILFDRQIRKSEVPFSLAYDIFLNGTKSIFLNISENFIMIEDPYYVRMYPVLVVHQSFIFEKLDQFILRCHEIGFEAKAESDLEKLYEKFRSLEKLRQGKKSNLKVLSLEMLEAGFVVWIALIPVAFLFFIGEHVVRYNSKRRRDARRRQRRHNRKMLKIYLSE